MGRQSRSKARARADRPRPEIAPIVARLTDYESELSERLGHGAVWTAIDRFVAGPPEGFGWPNPCLVTTTGVHVIVAALQPDSSMEVNSTLAILTHSIYCWRYGRGIYRFDAELAGALLETDLDAAIPDELMLRLPEWCCYIAAPTHQEWPSELLGAFVNLDWNKDGENGPRFEVRILFETEVDGMPGLDLAILPLGYGTLGACFDAWERAVLARPENQDVAEEELRARLEAAQAHARRLIGMLLYLASTNADVIDVDRNAVPPPLRPPRLGPSRKTRMIDVGFRVGPLIRDATRRSATVGGGRTIAPHLRRAHWHHYWAKSDDGEPGLVLRWIMPTFVGGRPRTSRVRDL